MPTDEVLSEEERVERTKSCLNYIGDDVLSQMRGRHDDEELLDIVSEASETVTEIYEDLETGMYEDAQNKISKLEIELKKIKVNDKAKYYDDRRHKDVYENYILDLKVHLEMLVHTY